MGTVHSDGVVVQMHMGTVHSDGVVVLGFDVFELV